MEENINNSVENESSTSEDTNQMVCPKCGTRQEISPECKNCQIIFSKYKIYKLKKVIRAEKDGKRKKFNKLKKIIFGVLTIYHFLIITMNHFNNPSHKFSDENYLYVFISIFIYSVLLYFIARILLFGFWLIKNFWKKSKRNKIIILAIPLCLLFISIRIFLYMYGIDSDSYHYDDNNSSSYDSNEVVSFENFQYIDPISEVYFEQYQKALSRYNRGYCSRTEVDIAKSMFLYIYNSDFTKQRRVGEYYMRTGKMPGDGYVKIQKD